jgi:hypothetical protein
VVPLPGSVAAQQRPGSRRRGPLIAMLAIGTGVVMLVGLAVVVLVNRPTADGPDPFAGAYPLVGAPPDPGEEPTTWQPTGQPAGPLRKFPGTPTRVTGRIVDRRAGVSYARLARPYGKIGIGRHTGGQEFDNEEVGNRKARAGDFWYCAVYSGLVQPALVPAVRAAGKANAMRAAAELEVSAALESEGKAKRTDIAGQPLTVSGRRAWLTAVQIQYPPERGSDTVWTKVYIAVDTGRARPALVEVHIPNTQNQRLPDINTIVRTLRAAG